MSQAEVKAASCDGKQAFVSPSDARKVAKRCFRYSSLHSYRCRFCGRWHLGNDNPGKDRRG